MKEFPPARKDQTMSEIKTTRLEELEQSDRIVGEIEQMFEDGHSDEEIMDYINTVLS